MQWYAVTDHADLAFGTVAASACCGAEAGAQVTADPSAGGPYTSEYVVRRQPQTSGQAEQAVDVSVVSSTLPIVDPARITAAVSTRVYSKY